MFRLARMDTFPSCLPLLRSFINCFKSKFEFMTIRANDNCFEWISLNNFIKFAFLIEKEIVCSRKFLIKSSVIQEQQIKIPRETTKANISSFSAIAFSTALLVHKYSFFNSEMNENVFHPSRVRKFCIDLCS